MTEKGGERGREKEQSAKQGVRDCNVETVFKSINQSGQVWQTGL